MTFFYSHLLSDLEKILAAIDNLPITKAEKHEAVTLVEQTIHHAVIDSILEHLHEKHHEHVLAIISHSPADRAILNLVNALSEKNIEGILQIRLRELQIELLEDLINDGPASAPFMELR